MSDLMTFVIFIRKPGDLDNSDIGVWVAPDYRGLPRAKGRFLATLIQHQHTIFSLIFLVELCQVSIKKTAADFHIS